MTSKTTHLRLRATALCRKALKTARTKARRRQSARARRLAHKIIENDLGLKRVRGCVSGEMMWE